MDTNVYIDELILGYLGNELTDGQKQELETWLSQDTSHRKYFYEMVEIWGTALFHSANKEQKERAYIRFKQRVDNKKRSRRLILHITQIAAAVLLGILFTGLGISVGKKNAENQSRHVAQTIEVPLGSRTRVVLRDGTVAWLNAGSKLDYTMLHSDERRLQLEGEAYFEVATDKKRPFIIETSLVDVEVLGTKFSVKDYGEDDVIEVILAEGLVNFINKKNPEASVVLKPGRQAVLNKSSGEVTCKDVSGTLASVWTTGAHFFNEYTLEQIAKILEKSFDVAIIFRDEKKKELTFYSDFRNDNTLDDILDILSSSRKFKYTKNNDIIEIF